MQYKIESLVVSAETTAQFEESVKLATASLKEKVQLSLSEGWELQGGAQITATKLGHIAIIQTMKKRKQNEK